MDHTQIKVEPDFEMKVQDTDLEENKTLTEATFRLTIHQFSKLEDNIEILSEACYVQNLPWKIKVVPWSWWIQNDGTTPRYIKLYLECNGESKSPYWACYAVAELRILSVRPDVPTISLETRHLFHSESNDMGFTHFIAWNYVLNPKNGYIKNNTVTFEAYIAADAPHGVTLSSIKHMSK